MFRLISYRTYTTTLLCQSRYQSSGRNAILNNIQDDKLRQIIESSNLGSEKESPSKQSNLETDKATDPKGSKTSDGPGYTVPTTNTQGKNLDILGGSSDSFTEKMKKDIKDKVDKLPSQKEEFRYHLAKTFEQYMDSMQNTIFRATRALNDVTGYSAIEQLRATIDTLESDLKKAKEQVRTNKEAYTSAISERSLSQKEVNELLTRKHNWGSGDLERFTQLYRNDHVNEQNELHAQQQLNEAEQLVDSIQLKLTQSILTRYHEEQIWSDKIRRASTWGTWGLMGFNILLFFTATFVVEPWKRRRMVDSFEDKVRLAISNSANEQAGKMDTILTYQAQQANKETPEGTYTFQLPSPSWGSSKAAILANYNAIVSPDVSILQFEKAQLAMVVGVVSVIGSVIGSLVTVYFK